MEAGPIAFSCPRADHGRNGAALEFNVAGWEEHPMGSRTRFAVAMGLLQCVAICPGLPASAQAPDRADAEAARKEGNSELVHLDPGRSGPAACRQVPAADRDQGSASAHRRPGGAAAATAGGQRRPARRRRDDHVRCAAPPTVWPSRACSSRSSRRASTRWWPTPAIATAAGSPSGFRSSASRSAATRWRKDVPDDLVRPQASEIQGPHGDAGSRPSRRSS